MESLTSYFSGSMFSKQERFLLYPFFGEKICVRYASEIIDKFKSLKKNISKIDSLINKEKYIAPYRNQNSAVLKLKKYLGNNLKPYLIGAYIHGSLGTGEDIPYSDFDALLIFNNKIFDNIEILGQVCCKTLKAASVLVEYDPLQHHGFFILTELDLDFYCEAYFPTVIFDYSKSLFDDIGLRLSFKIRDSQKEAVKMFKDMALAIKTKLENERYPKNYYELKLLLSQFMLLPSLYLQAKGEWTFKRDSFCVARKYFSDDSWLIMDEVSQIRKEWDFRPSFAFQLYQKTVAGNPFLPSLYQIKVGQPLSKKISNYLTGNFYLKMLNLLNLMKLEIL